MTASEIPRRPLHILYGGPHLTTALLFKTNADTMDIVRQKVISIGRKRKIQ